MEASPYSANERADMIYRARSMARSNDPAAYLKRISKKNGEQYAVTVSLYAKALRQVEPACIANEDDAADAIVSKLLGWQTIQQDRQTRWEAFEAKMNAAA